MFSSLFSKEPTPEVDWEESGVLSFNFDVLSEADLDASEAEAEAAVSSLRASLVLDTVIKLEVRDLAGGSRSLELPIAANLQDLRDRLPDFGHESSAQCFHNGLLLEEGAQLGSLFSFEDDGVLVVHVLPSPKPPMQPRSASPLFPSEAYACAAVLAARKRRAARLVAAGLVLALACVAARGAPRKGVGPQCNSVNEDSRAKRPTLLANEHSHEIGGGVLTHLTHLRTAPTLPVSQPSASAASAGAFEWPRFMPRPVVARNSSSIRPRTPVSSRPGGAGASPVAATSALAEPRPMLRLDAWLQAGRQKVVSVAAKHTAEWLQAGRKNAARAVHGAVAAARKGWSVACDALATLLLALLAKFKGVKKQP